MKIFNVESYNPQKNYVIEASAGTGKTYNIVRIVEKLVNQYHYDINQILIVTYTEKACGELKNRIHQQLNHLDINNSPIFTIHSFCQNTIKENGFTLGLPQNIKMIEKKDIILFCEEYIRSKEILEDISLFKTSNQINVNEENIKDILIELVGKYYLNDKNQEDEFIIQLEKTPFLKTSYDYCLLKLDKISLEDYLNKNQEVNFYLDILKNGDASNAFYNEIYSKIKNDFNYDGRKYQQRYLKNYSIDELNAFIYFKELKEEQKKLNGSKILAYKYLKDFYIKYQEYKINQKAQDFDDMIRNVRESIINNPTFKEKLKQQYKIAIIDEFQDTNQKQFDIFKRIFLEDENHHIIVVGDPKQSIYSFQGADVNVYYEATNYIEQHNGLKEVLNKNYRSTKNMVESCNQMFQTYQFSNTSFVNSLYMTIKEDKDTHQALYQNQEFKAFWVACEKPLNPDEFALIATEQILDLCSKDQKGQTKLQIKEKEKAYRNVSFKDFAVLARTRSEMEPIERIFKNVGIPYIKYKDDGLFLGKECNHWIMLLNAIICSDFTGNTRKYYKQALFSDFFGFNLTKLNTDYTSKDDTPEIQLIQSWQQLAKNEKWEELIDGIMLNSYITNNLKTLKELQSLSIYKQIASYLINYLTSGNNLQDAIRNLVNLSKKEQTTEDDSNIVEKSTNFDCVQLMTMHASKGLQFPIVISVAGYKEANKMHKSLIYHHNKKPILTLLGNETSELEETEEWKRLFYVGYTRPQFLLILPYYEKYGKEFLKKTTDEFLKNNNYYQIITKSNQNLKDLKLLATKILTNTHQDDQDGKEKQNEVLKLMIKNLPKKKIKLHSYSSLSHHEKTLIETFNNKEGFIDEGLQIFDQNAKQIVGDYQNIEPLLLNDDYPQGAKLGTILHMIFELIDFTNYHDNLEQIIIKSFKEFGINPKNEWIEQTIQIVDNVLNAKIPLINGSVKSDQTFRLNQIQTCDKLSEVEFNFNLPNQKLKNYCNGFIDLIIKIDDYYALIDWKSDKLSEEFKSYNNPSDLKEHVDEAYAIQRVLYSYCLIKWLKQYLMLDEEEIFKNHFGGIYYIFLRGCINNTGNGVYAQTWNSFKELEKAFKEIIENKIGGLSNE